MQSPRNPQLPDKAGDVLHWRKLHGSAASLAVASLAQQAGPLVYVCSQAQHMTAVASELRFFLGADTPVYSFPDWECLPYDRVSPHPDIISQRLLALHRLPSLKQGVLVIPITALMQRLAPKSYIDAHTFQLAEGDDLDTEAFRQRLVEAGYYSVDQVMAPGEFAIRGGIVDVYPSGEKSPFRLDLFDTTIESIRLFDTESQRSTDALSKIELLPAREFPLDEHSVAHFRQAFRATVDGDPKQSMIYREVSKGLAPTGAEFYLPLFFEHTNTLFDFLPTNTGFVLEEGAMENAESLTQEITDRYNNAKLNSEWPPLAPELLFLTPENIFAGLKSYPRAQLLNLNLKAAKHIVDFDTLPPKSFTINPRGEDPYADFIHYIRDQQHRTLLVAESAGRRESLIGLLKEHDLRCRTVKSWQEFIDADDDISLTVSPIDRGLRLADGNVEIITESQLYGERTFQRRKRSDKNRDPDAIIKSLAELNIGDPVVHEDHGVGRYRGLETLTLDGDDNEFATIEYQGGDKIYIPVLSLDLVSRYVGGGPETAPLHKMGSDTWVKLRTKAKEKAYDVAAELLEIQALRLARVGHAFPAIDHSYDAFSAGFGFEETPDQEQVISDVISDMTTAKPMDRLVCGDVGFGKTEIALRAAYMAIAGSKQVVILVPTTLLAQQHYNNFADRFADWPVNVELFSRFRSAKETAAGLKGIKDGTVDIAVGTHKLIQKGIEFKDLGLMIIDEEHRFGVRQKEQLKKLRSQVDILTLTATPIPRTLNFALSGLRDISVIATPPRARLSVKTFVREWDDALLKEALIREIRRGGQVYFLHNEVQTIEKMQARILDLVPEAQIKIGHGQMPERELESVMRDFYHQRFNVLLCTTIVESGIDVPTANTIIINRADRFGLAQLHQLRGRVGRSHHQAYAYMISPPLNTMTDDARKRLTAIESLDTLGAGFALASQDLEIRGAGELLGESQSGMIDQIGYSMYSAFLEQAIASIQRKRKLKNGESVEHYSVQEKVEINLHIPARFPDAYLPDVHMRLTMYKRIASAATQEQLEELQVETIDRFGLLPDSAKNLFAIAELKLAAAAHDVKSVEVGPSGGVISFLPEPQINFDSLMRAIASKPLEYRFSGADTIQVTRQMPDSDQRIKMVEDIFDIVRNG
ncbi:transcription-repair coupling factor [Arenicella xantha]|uniref:Transcription-repair-coupling factor n=1 Tax=Arenicella xantha TaxID=644221 RepID=A0A395JFJ8_9GAMM|nr:transcription-repair coupling factor [Arenicella xantha]RBP48437.1 transcription-repair coupling factor [Arenicella xantha]